MPLLRAHRRRLGAIIMAVLVLLLAGALMPDPMGSRSPESAARMNWRKIFFDRFAYARSMPFLHGFMLYALGTSSDPRVFIGRHQQLYYNAEDMVGQSAGTIYRADQVRHFVDAADALRRALAPGGARLLVLLPPSAQSITTDNLPAWWHISGPLEYDLALRELHERGIATIDLKAAFNARPDAGGLYRRTDAHWRWNAALLAFDLTMHAIGHADWSLDAASALTPLRPAAAGDLARLIGLQDYLTDQDYGPSLAASTGWASIDALRSPPYIGAFVPYASGRRQDGERLLVLGDSFTYLYWREFLLHTGAARIGWLHHAYCDFDYADVVRFRPTWVILAPTEREVPCPQDHWPRGLPK